MLHIVGTVNPTTHIHQSAPKDDSSKGKKSENGNVSETIKTRYFGADKKARTIPFVTGNSVRGLLRRRAADRVLDTLNTGVSRPLYNNLTTGKGARDEVGMQPPVAVLSATSKQVFAGLFGGGAYMHRSRYSMAPLFPAVAWCEQFLHPTVREQMIPLDSLRYVGEDGTFRDMELTTKIILTSRDDILDGRGERHIADYQASYETWRAAVAAGNVAKAEKKAANEAAKKRGERAETQKGAISVDIRGLNAIEAILPGTPLQFWLRFLDATPAQVGLMLLTVRDWANENVIGGASARGFGRFEAKLALYENDREIVPNLFNIGDQAMAYELTPDLAMYVSAAEEALKNLTLEELELVYPTGAAAKKKPKKAKGEASDEASAND